MADGATGQQRRRPSRSATWRWRFASPAAAAIPRSSARAFASPTANSSPSSGPTGCGKSTLLNIAAGLMPPSAGTVDIFGTPLAALNRQAGYLFQADALFPWKTALENVAIGLETAGTPPSEARPRAQDWLKRVGLGASATAIRTCSRAASASASASRRC